MRILGILCKERKLLIGWMKKFLRDFFKCLSKVIEIGEGRVFMRYFISRR